MGCGSSANKVDVVASNANTPRDAPAKSPPPASPTKRANSRPNSKTIRVTPLSGDADRHTSILDRRRGKGTEQTDTDARGGSAGTQHSDDSGFNDYSHVITEDSETGAVRRVESEFSEKNDLEMDVVGTRVPQRRSAREEERLEQQRILASLQSEGLIQRPVSRAVGGLAFSITEDDGAGSNGNLGRLPPIKPPARLAKLERRRKRKLTLVDIEAKLEEAERRRKELETERLQRIHATANQSDVTNSLDVFAERQKCIELQQKSKEEIAAENRHKKLLEKRERLRMRQQHAEEVRLRKKISPEVESNDPNADNVDNLLTANHKQTVGDN